MKLIDKLNFNISRRVPNSGIPLSFLNVPSLTPGNNVKIIGSGALYTDNIHGISVKDSTSSISLTVNNITSTLSPTGTLVSNKFPDPNLEQGGTYWTTTPIGYWTFLSSGGRSSLNSKYNTGDDPLGDNCVKVSYTSLSNSQEYTLYSTLVSAMTSGEAGYSYSDIGYQLSFWLASDPVNSSGYRINESGSLVNAADTSISVNVEYYNSSSTLISSSVLDTISYQDLNYKSFLNQASKKYFRYMSNLFKLPTSGTSYISIKLVGYAVQGLWFDDFKLSSYVYSQIKNNYTSKLGLSDNQILIPSLSSLGTSLLTNSSLTSVGTLEYNSSDNKYNIYYSNYTSYPSINIDGFLEFGDGTFAGKWQAGFISPATAFPVLMNPNYPSQFGYGVFGGTYRTSTIDKKSNTWMMLYQNGQSYELYNYLYTGFASGSLTFSGYEKASQSGANSSVKSFLRVKYLTSGGTVLNTVDSAVFTSSANWTQRTLTFSPSAYPTTTYVLVSVVCTGATSTVAHIWDDFSLVLNTNPISGWVVNSSSIVSGSTSIQYDNYLSNSKLYSKYFNNGSANITHILYSNKPVYKNKEYVLSTNYFNYYLGTEDSLVSSGFSVSLNTSYNLNFRTFWNTDTTLRADLDPTLRGCFTEPFTQSNQITNVKTSFNNYGYLKVIVEGINSTGGVSETPYNNIYGPDRGNLPAGYAWDSVNLLNYVNLTSDKIVFTNSNTVSGRVTFKLLGCNLGIGFFSFNPYSQTDTSNTTVYSNSSLYKITSPIEVDRVDVDPSGAWRACVKDGLFERRYTLSSRDSSGCWLRSVGFVNGDDLTLVYTVPEYNLSSYWDPENHVKEAYKLPGAILDDKTLYLGKKNIVAIKEIFINGTNLLSGFIYIDGLQTTYPDLISSVDKDSGVINFIKTLTETDDIEITFYYKEDRYIYNGYFDGATYHDLDLNPGAGHKYSQDVLSNGLYTRDLINSVVTIYLIPVGAYLSSQNSLGTYTYKTAFDVNSQSRPSSFVRHTVSNNNIEAESTIDPSAIVIGKVFVTPPGSISDVDLLDIRSSGGGISEEFDVNKLPLYFIQEFKVSVDSTWKSFDVDVRVGDILEIFGLGYVNNTYSTSGNLFGAVSTTTPTATGFLVNTHIEKVCGYTYNTTGSVWYNTSNQCPSGYLYLKLINTSIPSSGVLYSKIRIKRKISYKSIWDFGSWDGEPVIMNGVVVFEIPKDILTGSNGYTQFTAQQIEEIVNKKCPAGVVPIITYT